MLKLLTVLFLVLLNGFFVASEFAIVKVRGAQLDALEARSSKRVKLARHMVTHLDASLSATQLTVAPSDGRHVGQLHFHKLRDTAGTGSG